MQRVEARSSELHLEGARNLRVRTARALASRSAWPVASRSCVLKPDRDAEFTFEGRQGLRLYKAESQCPHAPTRMVLAQALDRSEAAPPRSVEMCLITARVRPWHFAHGKLFGWIATGLSLLRFPFEYGQGAYCKAGWGFIRLLSAPRHVRLRMDSRGLIGGQTRQAPALAVVGVRCRLIRLWRVSQSEGPSTRQLLSGMERTPDAGSIQPGASHIRCMRSHQQGKSLLLLPG